MVLRLELYTPRELATIVSRSARILNIECDEDGALEIASRCRGTPRIANRMLKRVRDFAQVMNDGVINTDTARGRRSIAWRWMSWAWTWWIGGCWRP